MSEWIPCAEKLPNEELYPYRTYLVSVGKYPVVSIAEYRRGRWILLGLHNDVTNDVVAWASLPEPYKMNL